MTLILSLGLFACGGEDDLGAGKSQDAAGQDAAQRQDAGDRADSGVYDSSGVTVRPQLTGLSPASGSEVEAEVELSFSVEQAAASGYQLEFISPAAEALQSAAAIGIGDVVSLQLSLQPGANVLRLSLLDEEGVAETVTLVYTAPSEEASAPPVLVINPVDPPAETAAEVQLGGTIVSALDVSARWENGAESGEITLSGAAPQWSFTASVPLVIGANEITITATNEDGSVSEALSFTRAADTVAPALSLSYPRAGHTTDTRYPQLRGAVSDAVGVSEVWVTVGGARVATATVSEGRFQAQIYMDALGDNAFTVHAVDAAGNESSVDSSFYFGSRMDFSAAHGGVVRLDGALFMWGRNSSGEVGIGQATSLGDEDHPAGPVQVELSGATGTSTAASLNAQNNSSMVVDTTGHVWAFGKNSDICLETEDEEVLSPTRVDIEGVVSAKLGKRYSIFLMDSGDVYVCGSYDKLVPAEGVEQPNSPVQVEGLSDIVQVIPAQFAALALDKKGRVFAWGANSYGQLGQGETDRDPHTTPVRVPGLPPVVLLAGAGQHVLALTEDNRVYGWGRNFMHQIGDSEERLLPSPTELAWSGEMEVVNLHADGNQSYCEDAAGLVYGWGQNNGGTLGTQSDESPSAPNTPVFGVRGVLTLGIGRLQAGVITEGEHTYAWGWNFEGSLGGGAGTINRWTYRNPVTVQVPAAD